MSNAIDSIITLSNNERAFLLGLEKLTRETGVVIGGCGCCSSPFLEEVDTTSEAAGYGFGFNAEIKWIAPDDEYAWEYYSTTIIKQPVQHEEAWNTRPDEYKGKYHELIMAVSRKHPNETRHETALRYIQQAERQDNAPQEGKSTTGERR